MKKKEIISKLDELIANLDKLNNEFTELAESLEYSYWHDENEALEDVSRYVCESQCVFEDTLSDLQEARIKAERI